MQRGERMLGSNSSTSSNGSASADGARRTTRKAGSRGSDNAQSSNQGEAGGMSFQYSVVVHERLIAEGSSGTVFQGLLNGAPVAVKRLHAIAGSDSSSKRYHMYKEELIKLRNLAHPHVIQFMGLTAPRFPGEVPGIVMGTDGMYIERTI